MDNSSVQAMNKDLVVLYLTNIFCTLRKYIHLDFCKVVCSNITTRMLTNQGENFDKNLEFVSNEMNIMVKSADFNCNKHLTRSFLENVVIPQDIVIPQDTVIPQDMQSLSQTPDQVEWTNMQDAICKEKSSKMCKIPFNDCTYEENKKQCVSNINDYTLEKLDKLKKSNIVQAAKNTQLNEEEKQRDELLKKTNKFKEYLNKSQTQDDWVDRMNDYCEKKNEDKSCADRKNGCTKKSDKCVPDPSDYKNRNELQYKGDFIEVNETILAESKAKRNDKEKWIELQQPFCGDKNMMTCAVPGNDCKYENGKCIVNENDFTEQKLNQLKVKNYLNNLDEKKWKEELTQYCSNKKEKGGDNTCNDTNNGCTRPFGWGSSEKCDVDTGDFKKKDKLIYSGNIDYLINKVKQNELDQYLEHEKAIDLFKVNTIKEVKDKFDKDNNGMLDDNEIKALKAEIYRLKNIKSVDSDGDGLIDENELAEYLKTQGGVEVLGVSTVKEVMDMFDNSLILLCLTYHIKQKYYFI